MYVGKWCRSLRSAQANGLAAYFDQYRERYGFAHPEDPTHKHEGPLPYNVIMMHGETGAVASETCDELPGYARPN